MMTLRSCALISAGALLTTGCAGLLNKGNQTVQIRSDPPGAAVHINGSERGVTPLAYDYDMDDGRELSVELRLPGYDERTFTLTPVRSRGVLLADALLFGIPYIVDSRSNALFSFHAPEINARLDKALPADLRVLDLPVVMLENRVASSDVLGKIGTTKVTARTTGFGDLGYPDLLTSDLMSGLHGSYLNAHTVRRGTTKGDEAVREAKYFMKPVLASMELGAQERQGRLYGLVQSTVLFEFHHGLRTDSVVFVESVVTRTPLNGQRRGEVVEVMLRDAAWNLLHKEGLHDRLSSVRAAGLVLSMGDAVTLSRPRPIPFGGRKDMLAALVKGVVTIETKDGHGSGFVITNDGYLLTNAHVVDNAKTVKVRFEQGFALEGQVTKVNRDFDLALVKVPGADLPALTLGNDTDLQLGEEIFAIGTPLDEKLGQTVTRGIMSGRREIEERSYLQTDVSINPGNSGGPLIDESGKVIGVATLKVSGKGIEGIGFGVPISTAVEMLNIQWSP